MTTLGIRTHELPSDCAISAVDAKPTSDYLLTLAALGPFAAEVSDVARNVPLDANGLELGFDARSAGVDAIVTDAAAANAGSAPPFAGHSERRRQTGIDVLLWPNGRACSVAPGPYPGGNGGQALGYSSRSGVVLSAGEDVIDERSEQDASPGSALAFEADRGTATLVPREGALSVPRAFASVSELGADLLVAGGENPLGASSLDAAGTAEVFSSNELAFTTTINLTLHRARHAAVTLPTTGETLLIGGYEPEPQTPGARPREIYQFEAISPALGASISGLGRLSDGSGRLDPTALVLSDGRVFVGGGTAPGEDQTHLEGAPVGLVEWFSPDAQNQVLYAEPKGRPHRTFAPLPGGGVLSVASCYPEDRDDCSCVTSDGTACGEEGYVEGSWLDREGNIEPVAFVVEGSSVRCPTPKEPLLAPGSDGSPWLIGAGGDGTVSCLWRFQPWPGESGGSALRLPRFVPTDITLDPAPDEGTRLTSLGPDAFVWIGGGEAHGLFGVALGHRGALTRDAELLTAAPGEPRPEHLAPDHNPNPSPGSVRKARATFDANNFRLTLEPPEPPSPPLTVWVTDTTYDDARVSVSLALPPGTTDLARLLPVLVFGGNAVSEATCTWPTPNASTTGQLALSATRHGTEVTLAANGTVTTQCTVAAGSLAMGVRAGAATTTLVSFAVERQ